MVKPRQQKPQEQEDTAESKRLTAPQIFRAVEENGREELKRSSQTLAFSAVAGGITMGLTGLGVASVRALVGDGGWEQFVSYLVYPVGFVAVIIGRAQLFTENTLYPVVLVLDEHRYLVQTLRLWGIVFACNLVGALLFALLAVKSAALSPDILSQMVRLGTEAVDGSSGHFFWSAVVGGWVIALVAWVVTASHWTSGHGVAFDICGGNWKICPLHRKQRRNNFCRPCGSDSHSGLPPLADARGSWEHCGRGRYR